MRLRWPLKSKPTRYLVVKVEEVDGEEGIRTEVDIAGIGKLTVRDVCDMLRRAANEVEQHLDQPEGQK